MNGIEYINNNREKHCLPVNKGLQPLVHNMLTRIENAFEPVVVQDGFDIVIGNPPYHQLSKDESASETYKLYLKARYKTSGGRLNTFIFFMLEGHKLMKQNGNLIYIIPNTLLTQEYYKDTRSFLLQNSQIDQIIHYPTMQFENAVVENITIQYSKTSMKSVTRLFVQNKDNVEKIGAVDFYKSAKAPNYNLNVSDNYILDKIDKQGFCLLEDLCEINQAIALKGDKDLSLKDSNPKDKFYKLLDGRNINKYKIHWGGVYLDYDLNRIHSCKRKDIFESKEKLMFRRVSSDLIFTYDSEQFFALNTIVVLNKKSEIIDLKCLLGVLNSSLVNYYYKEKFKSTKTVFSEIQARSVGRIPICSINKQPITIITGYLIHIGKSNFELPYFPFLKSLIDAMVYELYLPDEIKAADCEVLKHLTNTSTTLSAGLPEIKDDWSDEKKLETIEKVYKELSAPNHPVSIAMEKQKTVPEVRIIEGCPERSRRGLDKTK